MRYTYSFEEGDWRNKKLLGGKGSSLAQMTQMGFPVPPGFTITTEACIEFYRPVKEELDKLVKQFLNSSGEERDRIEEEIWSLIDKLELPEGLMSEVIQRMEELGEKVGKRFGDPENPLLVSVRSGAPVSMPGMMDTILNLGLNDETVQGLARQTGDERFAYDAYRRFLRMYGEIALGMDGEVFNRIEKRYLEEYGVSDPAYLPAEALKKLAWEFRDEIIDSFGEEVLNPWNELENAVKAVFRSWMNARAIVYRHINNITEDMAAGTAVNIQAMVFGNMGEDSGTGVVFSRDVATGENRVYGEFLQNAQGEDVVAGIRTPKPIESLKEISEELYRNLIEKVKALERFNREVQDVEFTVERGRLYFLQARNAKMTPRARVKTAVDMALEGLITVEEAILKVKPRDVEGLLYPQISHDVKEKPIAKGIPASPGAVAGRVVFTPDDAVKYAEEWSDPIILVRIETSPEDVHGFYAAEGILTSKGGNTSHAAVVARAMGKTAVVGAEALKISYGDKMFTVDGVTVREGDWITIDGSTGNIYLGKLPLEQPEWPEEFKLLMEWVDRHRRLGVWANADLPEDAAKAREFGAEGIGLLRIERMFRKPERLELLRQVILARDSEERREPMERLSQMVKEDFKEILKVMDGLPVIIRLIDPPLHEFLPKTTELMEQIYGGELSDDERRRLEKLLKRVMELEEANPMMGHRGVRVGVTHPEIYEGLVKAILDATAELIKEGYSPKTEIMIPQVALEEEVVYIRRNVIDPLIKEASERHGIPLDVKIGTMIETVRATLIADKLARHLDFFSFGTNDLTQATFSFSRDDVENKFLPKYLELGLLKANPFQTIDREGVGELIKICVSKARKANPEIEIGLCGEHGGDPESIEFLDEAGLDYVSASPYRILVARLAAAHSAIKHRQREKVEHDIRAGK